MYLRVQGSRGTSLKLLRRYRNRLLIRYGRRRKWYSVVIKHSYFYVIRGRRMRRIGRRSQRSRRRQLRRKRRRRRRRNRRQRRRRRRRRCRRRRRRRRRIRRRRYRWRQKVVLRIRTKKGWALVYRRRRGRLFCRFKGNFGAFVIRWVLTSFRWFSYCPGFTSVLHTWIENRVPTL